MGFAPTDTGTANITIEGDISIEFTVAQIDLGSGFTNDTDGGPTIEQCIFDTNGTNASDDVDCVFDTADGLSPFTLRNVGNQNVQIDLEWDRNAASLLGGTSPVFEYAMELNEAGSCSSLTPVAWTSIANSTVCPGGNFNFEGASDALDIHLRLSVPQDATVGSRTVTVTATAS